MDLAHSYRLGPEDAPVEVIVFSDFQCSFCKRAAAELKRINTRRPGRVKVYFKHYPLSYHPQAINAARASQAAGAQGKFWEMHDLLFANATELNDEIYAELATRIDLDVKRFNTDMSSQRTADEVSDDRAQGEALGVDGTPYFFIDTNGNGVIDSDDQQIGSTVTGSNGEYCFGIDERTIYPYR